MTRLFGEKLRALRYQQKLTQAEVAQQLGLASHSHVANLERGEDVPSLALTLRVAQLFEVAADYLLRDDQPVEAIIPAAIRKHSNTAAAANFGIKLRTLRQQRNLSQLDVARQLGLARQGYVSNLEMGRKAPSLRLVVQIADLFNVTADYLLRDEIPVDSSPVTPS